MIAENASGTYGLISRMTGNGGKRTGNRGVVAVVTD